MKALMPVLLVLVAACSGSGSDSAPEAGAEAPSGNGTVFDPLTSTLDRAAGVEDTIAEADAELRREIDRAQGL